MKKSAVTISGRTFLSVTAATALMVGASLYSSTLSAYEAGDVVLRFGPTLVSPDDSSSDLVADNLGNLTQALGGKTGVGVDDNTQPGITATYMLSDHLGVELLAAAPFEHDISAVGTGGLGVYSVGDTKQLPPTLSLLYFPAATTSAWQPFVGIGVNYTVFFDESTSGNFESVFGDSRLSLDDSWGLAARLGVDYNFNANWGVTASVWWVDIDTDATVSSPSGAGLGVTQLKVKAEVDPTVFLVGLNYRF